MNHCPRCDFRSRRSRFVLLLLSLLICFGLGGIHRIYAGKVISGIIRFLFLTLMALQPLRYQRRQWALT